jgi:cob(I)alamin adenosyltransferase
VKIYTKTGDEGETGLYGGGRVPKDHVRVEAYGAVDEANAALGVAIAHLESPDVGELLVHVQNVLFEIGAILSTPPDASPKKAIRAIAEEEIARLERAIDDADGQLPDLRQFILPGGTLAGAALHHARTVVRRAERRTAPLTRGSEADGSVLRYLNRLSDLLFVLARLENRRAGEVDRPWAGPGAGDA